MSDWLEKNFASHIFGSGTLSKPSTLAFALLRNPPTDGMTGATIPEVSNAGGYARQTLNPSSSNWLDPIGTDGLCYNHQQVLFPTATADWGWVSGVAILDSATYGAGNVWIHGTLTTPKLIGVGDAFRFASGDLDITFA
jgi:hypothetical protein